MSHPWFSKRKPDGAEGLAVGGNNVREAMKEFNAKRAVLKLTNLRQRGRLSSVVEGAVDGVGPIAAIKNFMGGARPRAAAPRRALRSCAASHPIFSQGRTSSRFAAAYLFFAALPRRSNVPARPALLTNHRPHAALHPRPNRRRIKRLGRLANIQYAHSHNALKLLAFLAHTLFYSHASQIRRCSRSRTPRRPPRAARSPATSSAAVAPLWVWRAVRLPV